MNLTREDIRFLCTALGFTAVAMQGTDPGVQNGAQRAAMFADLIEEFCRTTLSEMPGAAPIDEVSPARDS